MPRSARSGRRALLAACGLLLGFALGFAFFPGRAERDAERLRAAVENARGWASYAFTAELRRDGQLLYTAAGRVQPMGRRARLNSQAPVSDGSTFRFTARFEQGRIFLRIDAEPQWYRVPPGHPAGEELGVYEDPLAFWARVVAAARSVRRVPAPDGTEAFALEPDWAKLRPLRPVEVPRATGGETRIVLGPGGRLHRLEADIRVGPQALQPGRYVYRLELSDVNRADLDALPPEAERAPDLP